MGCMVSSPLRAKYDGGAIGVTSALFRRRDDKNTRAEAPVYAMREPAKNYV